MAEQTSSTPTNGSRDLRSPSQTSISPRNNKPLYVRKASRSWAYRGTRGAVMVMVMVRRKWCMRKLRHGICFIMLSDDIPSVKEYKEQDIRGHECVMFSISLLKSHSCQEICRRHLPRRGTISHHHSVDTRHAIDGSIMPYELDPREETDKHFLMVIARFI